MRAAVRTSQPAGCGGAVSRICPRCRTVRAQFWFWLRATGRFFWTVQGSISNINEVLICWAQNFLITKKCSKTQKPRFFSRSRWLNCVSDYWEADDSADAASFMLGYLITGALSDLIEMVTHFPVCNITADDMFNKTLTVIGDLESCGFRVTAVITDNHKKNPRLYSLLSKNANYPEQSPEIPHPFDSSQRLFLLLDPVHILKCLRNNWMSAKRLTFPDPVFFYNGGTGEPPVSSCHWSHLSHAYALEQTTVLRVTRLTVTAVAPNSLERQNVHTAFGIFCGQTASGLKYLAKTCPGRSLSDWMER